MISTCLFLCWHWVCLRFVSNGSCVVVHVILDSDAQLAALQTSGERNWYEISHQIAGLSFLQIVKLLCWVFMTRDNFSLNANLYFDLQICFILSQMWCWSCQCQGLLDFLFPSFTAKHFWTQKYSQIQHLIVSSCAHINLATIWLSMLCVTKCVLHFDACVQVEDGKVVRHEDL